MKQTADVKRREVTFNVWDWVMVKLWPHRQLSASEERPPYSKFAKKYYGLYQILERVGKVAYRLQLPEGSLIHPVFHSSLLKLFHHSTAEINSPLLLPATAIENQPIITLLAILGTCWESATTDPKLQVLVQWEGLSPDDTSWEAWELKTTYHLEEKVLLDGIRDDRKENMQQVPTIILLYLVFHLLSWHDRIGEDAWLLFAIIILLYLVCYNSVIAFLL